MGFQITRAIFGAFLDESGCGLARSQTSEVFFSVLLGGWFGGLVGGSEIAGIGCPDRCAIVRHQPEVPCVRASAPCKLPTIDAMASIDLQMDRQHRSSVLAVVIMDEQSVGVSPAVSITLHTSCAQRNSRNIPINHYFPFFRGLTFSMVFGSNGHGASFGAAVGKSRWAIKEAQAGLLVKSPSAQSHSRQRTADCLFGLRTPVPVHR